MDAPSVLARLRVTAETIMLDACTITRATLSVLDEETGLYPRTAVTVYSGPCQYKPAPTSTVDAAGIAVDATRPLIELPWVDAAAAVLPGDVVTLTAGPRSGTVAEVYAEVTGTTSVARRYTCEQRAAAT